MSSPIQCSLTLLQVESGCDVISAGSSMGQVCVLTKKFSKDLKIPMSIKGESGTEPL